MAEVNDGGTAFPVPGDYFGGFEGMSLRDWFAGQALAGWLSSYPGGAIHPAQHDGKPADLARHSYALADAMLRARAKAEGQ